MHLAAEGHQPAPGVLQAAPSRSRYAQNRSVPPPDTDLHRLDAAHLPPTPVVIPLQARRALERVLGTSTSHIPVLQDRRVDDWLQSAGLDALSAPPGVFLPARHDLRSPAGQALLAHEFTHALRARQPSFLPAVLRRTAAPHATAPAPQHEEEVALATEHAAYHDLARPETSEPTPGFRDEPANRPTRPAGLPAPWEPMPYWDDPPGPRATPTTPAPSPPPAMPPPTAQHSTLASAGLHAADSTRPQPSPNQAPARAPQDPPAANADPAQPDIEHLAREVYGRLRHQLADDLTRHLE